MQLLFRTLFLSFLCIASCAMGVFLFITSQSGFVSIGIVLCLIIFVLLQLLKPVAVFHDATLDTSWLSQWERIIHAHNTYIFPTLLSTYLVAVIVQKISNLPFLIGYIVEGILYKSILLILLIVSACIVWIFDKDEPRIKKIASGFLTGRLYLLIVILSIGWSWIISGQIWDLSIWLRLFIPLLSGLLVFMIGIIIIEDEE